MLIRQYPPYTTIKPHSIPAHPSLGCQDKVLEDVCFQQILAVDYVIQGIADKEKIKSCANSIGGNKTLMRSKQFASLIKMQP
jgi:hypothetical protein